MTLKIFLYVIFCVLACPTAYAATESLHHDLRISLFPNENRLSGVDRVNVNPNRAPSLSFSLSKEATVLDVRVNGRPVLFSFREGSLRVPLEGNERETVVLVAIEYEGVFDDPIPGSPLNTDNPSYGITGVISEKGSFLQAGAGWYPEIPGSRPTYKLMVVAPTGVKAVSVGKSLGHITGNGRTRSTWVVAYPVEGLSLSAGSYVVQEKAIGQVRALTYFYPETSHLAKSYLDATARYITFYEQLFGPYPFDKFAVVENFFPTGYGFPSYTLLGSRVIRLPFIIHTSLGHEIAHCWWGNGVYVDPEKGNWSEGLTTYVADYLYKERVSSKEGRQYRLHVLQNFATLVHPKNDFPLKLFQSRYDPSSQAIGYGKGAMVFHMVRRRLGEKAFWEALRDVYREKLFQKASWKDFQKAFERRGECSLQGFFEQWLTRKGGPKLSLERIRSTRKGSSWQVSGYITQKQAFYELELDIALNSRKKGVTKKIKVSGKTTPFEISTDTPPERLTVDPDIDTFRYLYTSEIPPSINAIKGSSSVLVVLGDRAWPGVEEVAETLTRSLGLKNFEMFSEDRVRERESLEKDIVFVGLPQRKHLLPDVSRWIVIRKDEFILDGRSYGAPSDVFFGVFPHPSAEGRVMALFLPLSVKYAREVAGKITHYGKYSYLAFSRGRNQDKGIWPISESPLTHRWEGQGGQRNKGD